ncbi:MAG: exopolysaccharide biosynthesis polyprenyl glycosylphosphotransferase, partial [Aureibaculum sp.]|nr:exopolysaccharide biosynthesis polyprenyl glycosylphosphotransferase [Aureibaculum sp.]
FLIYINVIWLFISYYTNFYREYRYTKAIRIISQIIIQFLAFFLAYFAFFGIFKEGLVVNNQLKVFLIIFSGISIFKVLYFYLLKIYRKSGLNFRNIVVIGLDPTSKKITEIFNNENDLGYRFKGFFSNKKNESDNYLGPIHESYKYLLEHGIDEIYCSLLTLSQNQIKELTKFTNDNGVVMKLIPDDKDLYSKGFNIEYYDTIPVLKAKKLPFELIETKIIKRLFDIIFSTLIIVFVLSWLIPILWILIKLESKGPLFFKQKRDGLNGDQFVCFKFRSMQINPVSNLIQTTKNDYRITNVGKFIRSTSIDELPQFFNVLLGDMSVVGPRPHMKSQSKNFILDVENYMMRNSVKPGITGLAQIRGYRGEIEKISDIENRVRLDIFYIENWSFFLDVRIIIQTFLYIFKGDKKAY